jgi:hypothetical protein
MLEQYTIHFMPFVEWVEAAGLRFLQPVTAPVQAWYVTHLPTIQPWAEWMIGLDLFRRTAVVMCVLYCMSVWLVAIKYHASIHKPSEKVKKFRHGYFTLLTIQIIPLMVTGFALNDEFIILTRGMTLITIVICYGLVSSADGTFNTRWYKIWIFFWMTVIVLGAMSWVHDGFARKFVEEYEKEISWAIVITMIVFTVKGQWSLAVDLFNHFKDGENTSKRLVSQIPRFLMLLLPIPHYWFAPSGAPLVMGQDPIFLAHISGASGTFVVLVSSMIGIAIGSAYGRFEARRKTHLAEI